MNHHDIRHISRQRLTTFDLAAILAGFLLNTRDHCGNEAECISDFCVEEGIDPKSDRGVAVIELAQEKARREWNRCRRAGRA